MTYLAERLLERITRLDAATPDAMLHFMDGIKPLIKEAATALEAKDKELEALRGLLDEWEDRTGPQLMDRAETAERERVAQWNRRREAESQRDVEKAVVETLRRERDQAREALKPYVAATKHCPVTMKMCGVGEDHFRAARAITGED